MMRRRKRHLVWTALHHVDSRIRHHVTVLPVPWHRTQIATVPRRTPGYQTPQSQYNPALSGNPQSATSAQYPNGNPDAGLNPAGARNTDSCLPFHGTGEVLHNYASKAPAPGNIAFRW